MTRQFAFDRHFDGAFPVAVDRSGEPSKEDAAFTPLFVGSAPAPSASDSFQPLMFDGAGAEAESEDPFAGGAADFAPPSEDGDAIDALEIDEVDADADPANDDLVQMFSDDADLETRPLDPEEERRIRDEAFAQGDQAGYDRGRADGEAAAAASTDARLAEAIAELGRAIPDAQSQIDSVLERVERRASRLAFAVIRKIAAALGAGVAEETASVIMAEALKAAGAAAIVVVETDDAMADLLETRLESIQAVVGSKAEIELRVREDAAPGALRVLWETGGVEYDLAAASKEIETLIARAEEETAGAVWDTA